MMELQAQWVTLIAPSDRAIPEEFISGLVTAGIEPILHFKQPVHTFPAAGELDVLLRSYARWGARYVALFDRPNSRQSWQESAWGKADLVDQFLDIYLPLATRILDAGLTPVLPPLEPGGDYWDTAFLRAALLKIRERGYQQLQNRLVLGAYGFVSNEKRTDWGAGGPERWAGARPYHTPDGEEDQRGFHIFDWYAAISEAEWGRQLPMLLLAAGALPAEKHGQEAGKHIEGTLALVEHVANRDEQENHIPESLLGCSFWLLSADEQDPAAASAWFRSDGSENEIVKELKSRRSKQTFRQPHTRNQAAPAAHLKAKEHPADKSMGDLPSQIIEHYLLLPDYEWGVADWHLDVIRPYVKKHKPTVGFSLAEARTARMVTIVGGEQTFPDEAIAQLEAAGCSVRRIHGDGTQIATELATI
jgi:hypothetical protein